MLHEFKALRDEIVAAFGTQVAILRFGSATLALLLGVAVTTTDRRPTVASVVFLLFAPLASYVTLVMWSAETIRMMRAAAYISGIEDRVNALAEGDRLLNWEHAVHEFRPQRRLGWTFRRTTYTDVESIYARAVVLMFLTISFGSIGLGHYVFLHLTPHPAQLLVPVDGVVVLSFAIAVRQILSLGRTKHDLRTRYEVTTPSPESVALRSYEGGSAKALPS
jgi:hypothetical protein